MKTSQEANTPAKLKFNADLDLLKEKGVKAELLEDGVLIISKWADDGKLYIMHIEPEGGVCFTTGTPPSLVTPAETKEKRPDLNGNSETVVPEPDNNSTFWNTPPVEDKGNKEVIYYCLSKLHNHAIAIIGETDTTVTIQKLKAITRFDTFQNCDIVIIDADPEYQQSVESKNHLSKVFDEVELTKDYWRVYEYLTGNKRKAVAQNSEA